jgi:acetylornithine deacetylase/succinyl-diaminopimelate desuccinylase-like protein
MKGGLAAMIYAAWAIQEARVALDGRLGLMIVPDEETGGARGAGRLAEAGALGVDGIGMLTPEPSSGAVWNANRGALSLKITVRGKSAHVGLHFEGTNAFEGMMAVANRLLELKRDVETRKTRFRIAPEQARNSILLLGGTCSGGTNFNSVPGEMCFTIDRRINPEEHLEQEKARLFACFEELVKGGVDVEVEILQEGRAAGLSEEAPLARALAKSVAAVTGKPAVFELCPGLLETRYYAERGVPALAYGPGLLSVSHGPHEFVSARRVCDCAAVYALTAIELLAGRNDKDS